MNIESLARSSLYSVDLEPHYVLPALESAKICFNFWPPRHCFRNHHMVLEKWPQTLLFSKLPSLSWTLTLLFLIALFFLWLYFSLYFPSCSHCRVGANYLVHHCGFSSVIQSCPTLFDPMGCSTPGFPVLHQLPELTQTHVHWVGDAIQPSYPLLLPFSSCLQSFPASGSFQMSQFFASGGQSIEVSASASVLPLNIQDWFL